MGHDLKQRSAAAAEQASSLSLPECIDAAVADPAIGRWHPSADVDPRQARSWLHATAWEEQSPTRDRVAQWFGTACLNVANPGNAQEARERLTGLISDASEDYPAGVFQRRSVKRARRLWRFLPSYAEAAELLDDELRSLRDRRWRLRVLAGEDRVAYLPRRGDRNERPVSDEERANTLALIHAWRKGGAAAVQAKARELGVSE